MTKIDVDEYCRGIRCREVSEKMLRAAIHACQVVRQYEEGAIRLVASEEMPDFLQFYISRYIGSCIFTVAITRWMSAHEGAGEKKRTRFLHKRHYYGEYRGLYNKFKSIRHEDISHYNFDIGDRLTGLDHLNPTADSFFDVTNHRDFIRLLNFSWSFLNVERYVFRSKFDEDGVREELREMSNGYDYREYVYMILDAIRKNRSGMELCSIRKAAVCFMPLTELDSLFVEPRREND